MAADTRPADTVAFNRFDVVIVGAGLVGSALACALGDSSLRVALIEAQPLRADWPSQSDTVDGFDARVSALTVASIRWLDAMGVWSTMAARRVSPYRHMHVWDADGTGSISFDAQEVSQSTMGHIVENRITTCALLRRIKQHSNIRLIAPHQLQSLQVSAPGYLLQLDTGEQLQTALVVAADGANSRIRQWADFPVREWDYGHHAIVATVECELAHRQTAWQRFLPEGPLAFLPLADSQMTDRFCSIVWSAIPDYAEHLIALDDEAFRQQLGRAIERRLGGVKACSPPVSFPLRQRHAVDYVRAGMALVGDAAHTIHPLAGQGVNLGLKDAQVLAEEILRAQQRGLSPGSESVLKRYQRRRKADNLTMMAGMQGFKQLFEQNHLMVRWARNAGMHWLDKRTPIKRQIIRRAMGLL